MQSSHIAAPSPFRASKVTLTTDVNDTIQARAPTEHTVHSIRIYGGHITTLNDTCQQGCEAQHIARVLQGGELPVDAVAHAAHSPGDEGRRHTRHPRPTRRRPEDYRGETRAVSENMTVNIGQRVRECEGGEPTAASKCRKVNFGQGFWECQGGEPTAIAERSLTNTSNTVRECQGGDPTATPERFVADTG